MLAQRYACLPSDILHTSYSDYCINEACAIAGEARDARMIEQAHANVAHAPARRVDGLLVGSFSRE